MLRDTTIKANNPPCTIPTPSRRCSPISICTCSAKASTGNATTNSAPTCATVNGVDGVNFAVWAPNAQGISLVGDFNGWDARRHPMRKHIPGGIWELFVPGLGEGTLYKYHVKQAHGEEIDKSDPYGFAAEVPPRTASKVVNLDRYQWHDQEWIADRPQRQALDKPMSFYEVHLGSWRAPRRRSHALALLSRAGPPTRRLLPRNGLHPYRTAAGQRASFLRLLGLSNRRLLRRHQPLRFTARFHVLRRPLPSDMASASSSIGSPPTSRAMATACAASTAPPTYEHEDPRKGEHPDWGTLIFNYGRNEVRNFLISNALFWLDKYHLDGLRVDAVASMLYLDYSREAGEWVPNEFGGRENLQAISFLKEFNIQSHLQFPGVLTIAEESTAWPSVSRPTYVGGLGFSLKWNMGWMNDTLRYMRKNPIHRTYHHDELTFSLIYAFHENFVLPLSHDEVVHGKGSLMDQMPGDLWQKFANMRLLLSYMWTHPGKKLLFMGCDFGQWNEWNYDESLQWHLLQWESHQGLKKMVADVNQLMRREPALHEVDFDYTGFEWIDCHNWQNSVLVFMRKAKDPADFVIVACNFTPVPREGYLLGVPERCWYEEIYNSDSTFYGGSNIGNGPGIMATDHMAHGRPHSVEITLPPLAVVVLKPRR